MTAHVIAERESYRVVGDGAGRFAVLEARAGKVYSCDPHHSAEAPDTPEGMRTVISQRGWKAREEALRLFEHMVRGERHLAETLW